MSDVLLKKIGFSWQGQDYEIRVSLENGDLAHGDFIAQAYQNGKVVSDPVRENAMQAITGNMNAPFKSAYSDIVQLVIANIGQGSNMRP